jgi:hypothetical protein
MSRSERGVGLVTVALLCAIGAWFFHDVPERQAESDMRRDLSRLVVAEERFDDSDHYAPYSALSIQSSMPGVSRPMVTVRDSGWSAIVTHPRTGRRCAVGVDLPNPLDGLAQSGVVVCRQGTLLTVSGGFSR